ncbi:hypothetical protein HZS_6438, partial [Henneguya salminicola]
NAIFSSDSCVEADINTEPSDKSHSSIQDGVPSNIDKIREDKFNMGANPNNTAKAGKSIPDTSNSNMTTQSSDADNIEKSEVSGLDSDSKAIEEINFKNKDSKKTNNRKAESNPATINDDTDIDPENILSDSNTSTNQDNNSNTKVPKLDPSDKNDNANVESTFRRVADFNHIGTSSLNDK